MSSSLNVRPVQWFSKVEWKTVYLLMFGPESDEKSKKEALQMLLVWKSRNPYLPSGIESTLGLLEVDLQEHKSRNDSTIPERLLRLMYSSALMRFINHTLDDAQSKKFTLLQAAVHFDIPKWIINLRHEIAHGHELPSLNILKSATYIALNWLHRAYWEPQYQETTNNVAAAEIDTFTEEFSKLFNLHNSLILLRCLPLNIDSLSKISDDEIKNDLFEELQGVVKKEISLITKILRIVSLLVDVMKSFLKDTAKMENRKEILCDIITRDDSLFLSSDIAEKPVVKLNKQCIRLWEPFLTLLHNNNIISTLVIKLVNIANSPTDVSYRRKIAAQWVNEISIGLNKCAVFQLCDFNLENYSKHELTNQLFLKLLVNKYPSQESGLTLDLLHPVPVELTNLSFLREIFADVNPHIKTYVAKVFSLVEPSLKSTKKDLMNLVEIATVKNQQFDNSIGDRIYTVEDLKAYNNDVQINFSLSSEFDSSVQRNGNGVMEVDDVSTVGVDSDWKKANGNYDWSSCPIGLLPWQDPNTFNLFQ